MADVTDISHIMQQLQQSSSTPLSESSPPGTNGLLPNGKKTKGRVKIKMEYIGNKLRRYTTFSKRKTGIMKKAYELSTLTGTQVMLLVASETGHVYTYATKKLQPMIASEVGKNLIQNCLNAPGEGTDLQPSRTEFTFETAGSPAQSRKRKINDGFDPTAASIASFLPTMVNSSMFSNFNEEDYNQTGEGDSGDDTDSEEPSETGKDESQVEDPKGNASLPSASALDTLKEALKIAANTRQQFKKKSPSLAKAAPGTPAFIAPFLLQGLTSSPTNNGTMFQLPQGCVYTNSNGSSPEGGANGLGGNGMFMNSAKTADEATAANPLLSFPFQFNLQQMLESAALGAQIASSTE